MAPSFARFVGHNHNFVFFLWHIIDFKISVVFGRPCQLSIIKALKLGYGAINSALPVRGLHIYFLIRVNLRVNKTELIELNLEVMAE